MIRMRSETTIIDLAEILHERGIELFGDVTASIMGLEETTAFDPLATRIVIRCEDEPCGLRVVG
jgi:hypothetical protein